MSIYSVLKRVLPEGLKRQIRNILTGKEGATIIDSVLRKKLGKNIYFVQIGSNDGKQGDPLFELIRTNMGWRGIFVEPIPYLFERLKNNYENENRFIFLNVAISEEAGDRNLFYVAQLAKNSLDLPFWYDQLGSFDPNHIRKHFGDQIAPFIVSTKVRCQTLNEILSANSVERIDLFHVDAEGYDFRILRQLDFDRYKPTIILYEQKHLSKEEKQASENLLAEKGYKCFEVGGDTIGVRR